MVQPLRIKSKAKTKAKSRITKAHVALENLRVMISNEGEFWTAQGLEIDYFAEGSSLAEAQHRFQKGLAATFGEHIKLYGNVNGFLKPAPQEAWTEFFEATKKGKGCFVHSQSSVHDFAQMTAAAAFPFQGISYYQPPEELTA